MDFVLSYNNGEVVMVFPVIPNEAIRLERGQANQLFEGMNGEMQTLGAMTLATFDLEGFFPLKPIAGGRNAARPGSTLEGWEYVRKIEAGRARRIPFRAVHLDNSGREIFNLPVSVESFSYGLDQAGDIWYKLSFREYRFAAMPLTATLPAQAEPDGAIPTVPPSPLTQVVTASQAEAQQGQSEGGSFTRLYTEADLAKLGRLVMGEAGGIPSKVEQACVIWTVTNRLDNGGFGKTLEKVMAPEQFHGLRANKSPSDAVAALCRDVLDRWSRERSGQTGVGRVLPKDYLYFYGDGKHNWFYKIFYRGVNKGLAWDYSLPSPY